MGFGWRVTRSHLYTLVFFGFLLGCGYPWQPVFTQTRHDKSELVQNALDTLAPSVKRMSDDRALRMALNAYYGFKMTHPDEVRKPYLYFVDYGLDNQTPRGFVFDMDSLRVIEGPFMVAHGRNSSAARNGKPSIFGRDGGKSSLGLYVTQESYDFVGHIGHYSYASVGLRMKGVSGNFNDRARERGVVIHGAPYVTAAGAGRSLGCPAMEQARAHRLIPKLAEGSLVFLFSPLDPTWLKEDPWSGTTTLIHQIHS